MNKNLKKVFVPCIIMIILDYCFYAGLLELGIELDYSPHLGLIVVFGMLFGPYGALGTTIGALISDAGFGLYKSDLLVGLVTFAISILAYKLWYTPFKGREIVTKPKLSSTNEIILFAVIILLCSVIYTLLSKNIYYIVFQIVREYNMIVQAAYLLNLVNFSFISGIIGIWLSKYIDFVHIPKKSKREAHDKFYNIIGLLLVIFAIIGLIIDNTSNITLRIIEIIIIALLLLIYITKPIKVDIIELQHNIIPEKISQIFFIVTLLIILFSYVIASDRILITIIDNILPITFQEVEISILIAMDTIVLIFLLPSIVILRYVEKNLINPIISFSKIEKFIKKGDKIESEGLINLYSEYVEEENEIGILARSYSNLINYTNEYIENISTIEGEKQRIETELNIAEKIQKSNLPTKSIKNNDYHICGYSKPAKEVGGDFFDYYKIDDDNLAIIIGDASGKGVPAALLSIITQAIIKQIIKTEKDPAKVLHLLNNQLCEKNTEMMFITLWLGIYNKHTKSINFSNAGHDPPLINKGNGYEEIKMNSGIVLGIIEDFEFEREEIPAFDKLILYTDGVTDAKSIDNEFYSEERLINTLNSADDGTEIVTLLQDIYKFAQGAEQFDDMTLVFLERYD